MRSRVPEDAPAEDFASELMVLKTEGLYRDPPCVASSRGPAITIDGKSCLDFSSNDYLNLSGHAAVIRAAERALEKYGLGTGASRLLSGTRTEHKKLERKISRFKRTEAALLFNSGYAANTGTIPALACRGDIILSDELNHASIIDGARLSKAGVMVYRHKDVNHLEELLEKASADNSVRRRIIVTDTVFSMDGDIAPLKETAALAKKHNSLLMIDDAHATGVIGREGRGGLEYFGINDGGIIQMGTFSKALGCFGAFVACSRDITELLVNKARSFMYSTSLPPSVAAACRAAVDIVGSRSVNLRKRLWRNRERLCKGISSIGFDTLGSETPIVPVLIGDAGMALKAAEYLYGNGIFAPAIRPPTVPEGMCRIRLSVTAGHTDEDIDRVVECFRKI